MTRETRLQLVVVLLTSAMVGFAQSPATPAFEVAAIKPISLAQITPGNVPFMGEELIGDRLHMGMMDLSILIRTAYGIKLHQLPDGDKLPEVMFEIEAKLPAGATRDQVPAMLQSLLRDRFKLVIRRETRQMDTLALTVGKGGAKFQKKEPADDPTAGAPPAPGTTFIPTLNGNISATDNKGGGYTLNAGGIRRTMVPGVGTHLEASNLTDLAEYLRGDLGKPIVDKTGLTGSYDIKLDIPVADLKAAGAPVGDTKALLAWMQANVDVRQAPTFTAVEKLGLKLEQQKNPVDVILVEHVEKTPTEN